MIIPIVACSLSFSAPAMPNAIDYEASISMHQHNMVIGQKERDRIWQEIHLAVIRMRSCLSNADREASKITDVNIRRMTKSAIQGAIGGLAGRTPYTVIIGGCYGALAHIGGEAYSHFMKSRDHVQEAEVYARIADQLQKRLWLDR